MQLLHALWVSGTPEYAITPSRHALLLARIELGRTPVVLVRRHESEGPFAEGAETEPAVVLHLFEELVVCVEDLKVTRLNGRDHGVSALIDTVV
jgi:hypothetical protein